MYAHRLAPSSLTRSPSVSKPVVARNLTFTLEQRRSSTRLHEAAPAQEMTVSAAMLDRIRGALWGEHCSYSTHSGQRALERQRESSQGAVRHLFHTFILPRLATLRSVQASSSLTPCLCQCTGERVHYAQGCSNVQERQHTAPPSGLHAQAARGPALWQASPVITYALFCVTLQVLQSQGHPA